MDAERYLAYLELIESLLAALGDEDATNFSLKIDPDLIDAGLVEVMRGVASMAAEQGQQHSADFLTGLALQLEAYLCQNIST
jgi:hypothetical protein